jgi:hypothetical protein
MDIPPCTEAEPISRTKVGIMMVINGFRTNRPPG